jgi:hypothetical protein
LGFRQKFESIDPFLLRISEDVISTRQIRKNTKYKLVFDVGLLEKNWNSYNGHWQSSVFRLLQPVGAVHLQLHVAMVAPQADLQVSLLLTNLE